MDYFDIHDGLELYDKLFSREHYDKPVFHCDYDKSYVLALSYILDD
jgi:hypothetical protein